jgi:hypothetical protein
MDIDDETRSTGLVLWEWEWDHVQILPRCSEKTPFNASMEDSDLITQHLTLRVCNVH